MDQETSTILMLVVLFALMYFLMIRPENKRKKQAQEMRDSLKKGDVITTIGGVVGVVCAVKDDKIVIETSADLDVIMMSEEITDAVQVFTDFMYSEVYKNPVAKGEESKVGDILLGIWKYYVERPKALPEDYQRIAEADGLERAVTDYVSGMTDKYVVDVYMDLFIPRSWQVR